MMVPARPRAPLEVIEPQFVLELAVILFDPPAPFGEPHKAAEPEVLAAEIGEPVLGGGRGVRRPLDQQLDGRGGQRAATADAVGGPEGGPGKSRAHAALCALV